MNTDITRQVSASVYEDKDIRDRIYKFIDDRYHALVESYGINITEVLKHISHARKLESNHYINLFFPSLLFWIIAVVIYLSGGDASALWSFGAAFMFGTLVVITINKKLTLKKFLTENFSKNSYNGMFPYNGGAALIERHKRRQATNVICYSGYTPFVGSGGDLGGWSFVVDIDKGKKQWEDRLHPISFDEAELYAAISRELESLTFDNLSIQNKVFINGKSIRDNKDLLPDILGHPINTVSSEYIRAAMKNEVKDARYYKVIQIVDWQGDLILTDYLRIKKDQKSLFVESNYFLLAPISSRYKKIDATKVYSGFPYYAGIFFTSILESLFQSLASIARVFQVGLKSLSALVFDPESDKKKLIKCSPDYDYGATTSIRQFLSKDRYTQLFQRLDKERYFKIIEKRVFDLIGRFLDSKNIDTSEFREREASILNQGVIVTGGQLNSQNMAVGKESKIQSTIKQTLSNGK